MIVGCDDIQQMNFFSGIPTEIILCEILRWLSPPSAASLVIALGLRNRPAQCSPIYIRWRHLRSNGIPQVTLTAGSRAYHDVRILEEISVGPVVSNPNDSLYLHMDREKTHPWFLRGADDYVMAMSTIVRYPTQGRSLNRTALNNIHISHGELMMGRQPIDENYMRGFIVSCTIPKEVEEQPLIDAIFRCRLDDRDPSIDRYLRAYFEQSPYAPTDVCSGLLKEQIRCPRLMIRSPPHVYKNAITSGYLWWMRNYIDCWSLSITAWNEMVADFVPRLKGEHLEVPYLELAHVAGANWFVLRIPGIVKLFGIEKTISITAQCTNNAGFMDVSIAVRNVIGWDILEWVTFQNPTLYLPTYMSAGGEYSKVRGKWTYDDVVTATRCSLTYGRYSFFRNMIADTLMDREVVDVVCAECIKFGSARGLKIMLDCGVSITPGRFHDAILACPNADMVKLLNELNG